MLGAQELRPPLSYLALATHHADQAATLGLVSPVVLQVGFYLRDVGDVVGVDVAKMDGAKQYKVLWRIIARLARGVQNEEQRRLRRVGEMPSEYTCAREGCGIGAEKRGSLRRCNGRCPSDLKPHYCSRECQWITVPTWMNRC